MSKSTRLYKHYKNKNYRLLGTVRHSETLEEMALYESLYENKLGSLWVRPKNMFFESIEVDGVVKPRFEHIKFEFKTFEKLDQKLVQQMAALYEVSFKKPMQLSKIESVIKLHNQVVCVAAYHENKMIGYKLGYTLNEETFYSWLGSVAPEFQKLGIAGELMTIQHDWCRIHNIKRIETRTRNKFAGMLRLNLKHGFTIVGTSESPVDGVKILLEKKLT